MSEESQFKQFPEDKDTGKITLSSSSSASLNFSDFNLDIGWALTKLNQKTLSKGTKVYNKTCLGYVHCKNSSCFFFNKAIRPKSNLTISTQHCMHCNKLVQHTPCPAKVKFVIDRNTCEMECDGSHNHGKYLAAHLSAEEKKKFSDRVKSDPLTTPKKMVAGISSQTGENLESVRKINPILGNKDRTKYELRRVREQSLPTRSKNFLGELGEIMTEEFEGYVVHAQVSTLSNFIVAFTSPSMQKYDLPFEKFPIVTDVTYKVINGNNRYLCSSVIFVPEIRKSIVFFQAIIGGLSMQYFTEYFVLLFNTFKLSKSNFLGVLMDFSAAQRQGLLCAFNKVFNNNNNGGGTTEEVQEAQRYLKGCYMHWMQSLNRIACNHAVVPIGEKRAFLSLAYTLRDSGSVTSFQKAVSQLLEKFPACNPWLSWWMQPTVKSMIFRCGSLMKHSLRDHRSRTTNSVEAYHNMLYKTTLIGENTSLGSAFRQILKVCQCDGDTLTQYYEEGVSPSHVPKKPSCVSPKKS